MDDDTLPTKDMIETSERFEDAYNTHASTIYKFLFWRTKDVQLSEDLTSSTFQKAWTARRSFTGGSQLAWLYRIARNTLYDYWRKHKDLSLENESKLEASESMSTAELLDQQLEIEKLKDALKKLPADMQTIIQLRFTEGLPSKQVAKRLGIADGNVRIMQYRALKKLREYLQ
jgi:RNA polymerase sigma-70 factor, ECF subfamily